MDLTATHLIILAPAALHRAAWRALLSEQPDILVAGAVGEIADIPALLPPESPTAVLIDLPIPQPEAAARLRAVAPNCGMLFLVDSYELSEIVALVRAGAAGCLWRDASVGDLARAIIAAGRGEIVLPPTVAAQALAALARGEPPGQRLTEPLSEREAEVLHLLARGMTNKDIAQRLILSVRTVEAHLRSIFAKLGVRSRTEAALWAVAHGYGPEE